MKQSLGGALLASLLAVSSPGTQASEGKVISSMDCAALRDTRPQQVHEILAKAQRLGSDCFPKESSDVPSRSPDIAAMNEADRLIRKFRMAKKEPPTPPIIEDSRYSPLNEQRCKSSWGDGGFDCRKQ